MSALGGDRERAERLRRNLQNVRPPVPSRSAVSAVYIYSRQFQEFAAHPPPRPKRRRKRQPKPKPVTSSGSEPISVSEPIPESESIPEPGPTPEPEQIFEPETPFLANEDVDNMSPFSPDEESLPMDPVEGVAQLPTPPPEEDSDFQQAQAARRAIHELQSLRWDEQPVFQQVQEISPQIGVTHYYDFNSPYVSPVEAEAVPPPYTELMPDGSQVPYFSQWEAPSWHMEIPPQRIVPIGQYYESNFYNECPRAAEEGIFTDWRTNQDMFATSYLNLNETRPNPYPVTYQEYPYPYPSLISPYTSIDLTHRPANFTYTPYSIDTPYSPIYAPLPGTGYGYEAGAYDSEEYLEPEALDDKDEGTSSASAGMSYRSKRIAMMRPGIRRSSRRSAGAKDESTSGGGGN